MLFGDHALRIMLAIPCYKGFLAADTSKSCEELFLYAQQVEPKVEWIRAVSTGCPVLPRVRNSLVASALQKDCDAILFLDDDIGFEAKDVYRMIGHMFERGYGVIGAVPQKRNHRWDDPPKMAISPEGMRVNQELRLGLPSEPKLPMALTLIACQVFRDIKAAGLAPSFVYPPPGEEAQKHMAMYFGYELNAAPDWSKEYALARKLGIQNPMTEDGEDHYFCRRAAAAGYECLIDLEAELRHWEGQVLHDWSMKKELQSDRVKFTVSNGDASHLPAEAAA
jgi:hypothetical protein